MEKFVIQGGKKLQGEIEVRGAKNAAFPLLAATILTKEDCVIGNLPLIEDVFRMIEILQSMGADAEWQNSRTLKINTKRLDPAKINKELILRLRGSVLLFGPLLSRFGRVYLPQPGGCIIGARPIDTHLDAFRQLGAQVNPIKKGFEILLKKPLTQPKTVVLSEFSVTTTENILLFAGLQTVPITLKIADYDYQVQELISFLKKIGVKIRMPGFHTLVAQGSKKLKGIRHQLLYDPIEAGTFIVMGVAAKANTGASKGNVLVKNVELRFLDLFFKKLRDFGASFEILRKDAQRGDVRILSSKSLVIPKIQSFIYPGIHSDLQSPFGVLATQTEGSTLLHDPLYEGRLKYLEELTKMGADIYFTDPHRAIINGPTKLYGTDLGTFDLRGGAALIIAALIAQGRSEIHNIYQVDRGYERIEERLQKLGADIQRITT